MDIGSRFDELARDYAAGRLNEADLARLQEESLIARTRDKSAPLGAEGGGAVHSGAGADAQDRYPLESAGQEVLKAGKTIGPAERRVRLVHDLSGRGRIWLVRVIASPQDPNEIVDEFRAIKIFLPAGHETASLEPGRARVDLINLRSYLAKVRARVEMAVKLDHPNIARIHGWRQGADGWPFAEMDYVNYHHGRSLARLLYEQGHGRKTPWETVLKWLRPVAAALDYARRDYRFAHQHLDTDTIFITDQGAVRLLGFGLATEIREPRSVLFSTESVDEETAGESAVESVSAETAFRRDVFALALLVYQLLTGHSAYEVQGQPPGAVPRPSQLTDDAWQVLRRGLAYPSELCPTEAGPFVQALDTAQRSVTAPPSGSQSLPKWLGGVAAGLVLAVSAGLYWWHGRDDGALNREPPLGTVSGTAQSDGPVSEPESATGEQPEEGVLLREAEREIDQRAFDAASRVDTVAAYGLYLQRCPQCGYGKEARAAIRRLEDQKKIEALKAEFERLAVIVEEGHGDRGEEALSRLAALAALAPDDRLVTAGRQRVARAWAKQALASLDKVDLTEARKWLKKAESLQVALPELTALNQALNQAEARERIRQIDTEAFATAQRLNTRQSYWTYLERCAAFCEHRAKAEAALARLAPPNPVLQDRLSDGSQGPELVVIPAGEFRMGSPPNEVGRYSDEPLHTVRIEKAFAIGRYEVMFHEYERFAAAKGLPVPDDHGWGRGRRPVIHVNWRSAVAYTEWLAQQTSQRYRLPTEAEWEYAARAGTATSRYWGNNPNEGCAYANAADLDGKQAFAGWTAMQCRDGYVYTAPVGSYRSNDFDLYDMAGNVLEWTCSLYDKEATAPVQRCQNPNGEQEFVIRGGSWSDEPRNVRSADRHRSRPDFQDYFLGFRVVRELP